MAENGLYANRHVSAYRTVGLQIAERLIVGLFNECLRAIAQRTHNELVVIIAIGIGNDQLLKFRLVLKRMRVRPQEISFKNHPDAEFPTFDDCLVVTRPGLRQPIVPALVPIRDQQHVYAVVNGIARLSDEIAGIGRADSPPRPDFGRPAGIGLGRITHDIDTLVPRTAVKREAHGIKFRHGPLRGVEHPIGLENNPDILPIDSISLRIEVCNLISRSQFERADHELAYLPGRVDDKTLLIVTHHDVRIVGQIGHRSGIFNAPIAVLARKTRIKRLDVILRIEKEIVPFIRESNLTQIRPRHIFHDKIAVVDHTAVEDESTVRKRRCGRKRNVQCLPVSGTVQLLPSKRHGIARPAYDGSLLVDPVNVVEPHLLFERNGIALDRHEHLK